MWLSCQRISVASKMKKTLVNVKFNLKKNENQLKHTLL